MRLVVAAEDRGRRGLEHVDAVIGGDAAPVGRRRPARRRRAAAGRAGRSARRCGAARRGSMERIIGRRRLGPEDQPRLARRPAGEPREAAEILRARSPDPTCSAGRYWAGRCGSRARPAAADGRRIAQASGDAAEQDRRATTSRRSPSRQPAEARQTEPAGQDRDARTGRRCRSRRASQRRAASAAGRRRPGSRRSR